MPPADSDRSSSSVRKPTDADIDVHGLTHIGKIRKENQDHFLIATLAKQMRVDATSLPSDSDLPLDPERLVWMAMVADGVGTGGGGEEASRLALQAITQYVAQSTRAFYTSDAEDTKEFQRVLADAALQCHTSLLERAGDPEQHAKLATTLTLWLGLWPQAYLLQVGDSRCYLYRDDTFTQISRDQTMAQDLVDQGVLTRTDASGSRWSHVLSSAIGGREAEPVVSCILRDWGTIVLICSDGLTKHVSDERIAERLANLESAKQTAEALLQDALDDGGTDNITIIIGRTIKPDDL